MCKRVCVFERERESESVWESVFVRVCVLERERVKQGDTEIP